MTKFYEPKDLVATARTTAKIGIGDVFEGSITAGDKDWIAVNLVKGQTYSFAMVGTGGSSPNTTSLYDPHLSLLNSNGMVIADAAATGKYDGDFDTLTFTAKTSGTYFLKAEATSSSDAGKYTITMTSGTQANFTPAMGAGALIRDQSSWSDTHFTAPATITWAARASDANSLDASGESSPFSRLSSQQIAATKSVLKQYADVSGLTFQQVKPEGFSNKATMLFSNYTSTDDAAGAYAFGPSGEGTAGGASRAASSNDGDVHLNLDSVSMTDTGAGTFSYATLLHEVGHALGLDHPGNYNASPNEDITYAKHAEYKQDSAQHSVMSYFNGSETAPGLEALPDTLMMDDILAIQQLYGVNTQTRNGNTTYGFNANAGDDVFNFKLNTDPVVCIWDGGGNDTLDVSGFKQNQFVNLLDGEYSKVGGLNGNVSIAVGAVIENAVGGAGNDNLYGNAADNRLTGNAGNDVLWGRDGNDTLLGGVGNDRLYGSAGNDTLTGGTGKDTFVFDTALMKGKNVDVITDFSHVDDTIHLDNAAMTALGAKTGALAAAAFWSSASGLAHDASDRIIYNSSTGALNYDADGNGAGAAIQFATLTTKPVLALDDFMVV